MKDAIELHSAGKASKVALVACMRKLIAMLNALMRSRARAAPARKAREHARGKG